MAMEHDLIFTCTAVILILFKTTYVYTDFEALFHCTHTAFLMTHDIYVKVINSHPNLTCLA